MPRAARAWECQGSACGEREGRGADDSGHRLGRREVDDRGRALPGRAAALAPTVDMNPVLLKPQFDRTSSARIVRSEFWGG